jgi:hypothetical protein
MPQSVAGRSLLWPLLAASAVSAEGMQNLGETIVIDRRLASGAS